MNTAFMRSVLKYIKTHAEFVTVSVVIVILLVLWCIPTVSEGFGMLWGSYYCPSCSYKGQSDCSSCENCGYCITDSGYGECVQGDANGPHFRKDCAIWSYDNPPVRSPWYSPYSWFYPNNVYGGTSGYGTGLLYGNNSLPISYHGNNRRRRYRGFNRHRSNGRHRHGGYRFAGHGGSRSRMGNRRMMRGNTMSKQMRQRVRRNRNMTK